MDCSIGWKKKAVSPNPTHTSPRRTAAHWEELKEAHGGQGNTSLAAQDVAAFQLMSVAALHTYDCLEESLLCH